ncbi:hypothetical protein [Brevundimonas sp. GCM10030266]|uniref:hypothetical protein n=1 Tax=Brevundimonas sp. GCM10030266 TaxID=3273386 RepID=UPI00360B9087
MTSRETLTLTTPRRNILLAMVGCGVGLALGLWFVDQPENADLKVWSTLGIAVLGLGLILLALQLRFPPRLILTPEGFRLTGLIGVSIPWSEVERFFVYGEDRDLDGHGGVAPHAAWRLKDDAPSAVGMVAALNRKGGVPLDGNLPRNLGMAPEPLAALMEAWRLRYSKAGAAASAMV